MFAVVSGPGSTRFLLGRMLSTPGASCFNHVVPSDNTLKPTQPTVHGSDNYKLNAHLSWTGVVHEAGDAHPYRAHGRLVYATSSNILLHLYDLLSRLTNVVFVSDMSWIYGRFVCLCSTGNTYSRILTPWSSIYHWLDWFHWKTLKRGPSGMISSSITQIASKLNIQIFRYLIYHDRNGYRLRNQKWKLLRRYTIFFCSFNLAALGFHYWYAISVSNSAIIYSLF